MAISAWINSSGPPNFRTAHTILTKRLTGTEGLPFLLSINYQFGVSADYKKPLFVSSNTSSTTYQFLQSTTDVTNNTWSHIVCSISGTNLKIYLEGVLILNTTIDNSKRVANLGPLIIGGGARTDKPAEQFVGKIDDVRLYNRALTQDEISYLSTQ